MQGFLTMLIECSISMSVIILSFIVLTPLLSKRYAAKWLYFSWLVIVVGLIIPFRIHFGSALIQIDTTDTIPYYTPQIISENIENIDITDSVNQIDTVQQELRVIPWYQIAVCIWRIGGLAFITYYGLKHHRFIKMVNRWVEQAVNPELLELLQKIKSEMGIEKQVKLQICSCISSPMMIGFINPVILLPSANFSREELSFIIRHELVHFKRRDLWYKSLVFFATAMHWFNPVIYLMGKAIGVQCEISCDEEVLKGTDMDKREKYSKTIIGVIKNQARMQTAFSTNFYGGLRDMKNRILSIMNTTKKKTGAVVLCLIFIAIMGTGAAFMVNKNASAEEYSTNTSISASAQEQERLDQMRREEIAKEYAIYENYGLSYDQLTDSFYYDGKLVRFFVDKLDDDGRYFVFKRPGVIDLKAVRNSNNELIGILPISQEEYEKFFSVSQEEYDKRTESTKKAHSDSNYVDGPLSAYLNYGVSFDKVNKEWLYNNKPIHFLQDGERLIYEYNSVNVNIKNGVSLEVVRKANGEIDKIVEITD